MAGGTRRQTVTGGNGVLFEVIFKNADPRKKPSHGISLSYGGQLYSCNDAESVRSVHTIHTDDEDEHGSSKSHCQSKAHGRGSLQEASASSAYLKKSPRKSALQVTPLLKPSPNKPKRSRTLSPSHQSRARSILAPFSNLSRKLSVRRHSYDEGTKTKREKSQVRREKTKPLLDERPTMHSFPRGFQQAPPQLAYQNPFPMYHYLPVPQPQPVFGTAPMAFPRAQGATSTAQSPPELRNLQGHINHIEALLAANPIDLYAKRELDRLLAERNAFLDSATRRTAPATTPGHIETSNPKTDVRSIAEKALVTDSAPSNESQKEATASVASSEAPGVSDHHFCSGCGETRSPSFHRKHPFAKPVHNVCRKCREGKRASSIMSRYHFCSSCGIVRSKEYHRRRRSATTVSARSKICRKCHANSDSVRQSTNEAHREYKAATKDRTHKSVNPKPVPRSASQKGPVEVEPPARRVQPHRQGGRADDAEILGYDGVSDVVSTTCKTEQTESERRSVKEEAFTTYRSPEISDGDDSSNQPASLESSFHSSCPESPIFKERTAPEVRSPEISDHGSVSESLHEPQQDTTSTNPYYQPRNTAGRLSSPFHYEETSYLRPSPPAERAPSRDSFPVSDQYSGPDSPDPHRPCFLDRNQSWPGDLNMPSPRAFSHSSNTGRKVSASDGAPSPTTHNHPYPPHDFDSGERFTKGAFGRFSPSSALRPRSSSPPTSPWASFSGPIPNPASEPGGGSKGAFSSASHESAFGCRHTASPEPNSPPDSSSFPFRFGCRPTSCENRDDERATRGGFASTRGAWNVNTARTSAFAPRHGGDDQVPEPIIEEPSSPLPKSPLTTPLLLDAMSDSGVEFLTDPSSSSASSSSPSSETGSLLASHLDSLNH